MEQELVNYLDTLSQDKKEQIYKFLGQQLFGIETDKLKLIRSDHLNNNPISCPNCNSKKIIGFGKYRNGKRFRCKSCLKTFNEITGTPLANLKKVEKFCHYLQQMPKGLSLQKSADNVGICIKTSFDWRHKILAALSAHSKGQFDGTTERDDKQFEFSEKGRKDLKRKPYKRPSDRDKKRGNTNKKVVVVVSSDRKQHKDLTLTKFGSLDKKSLTTIFEGKLTNKNTLCTDSHFSYKGWARDNNIEHQYFVANKKNHVKDKVYHIQHVNSIDNKLERWLNKFWGVATKYLHGYLNWFKIEDYLKNSNNFLDDFLPIIMGTNKAWIQFNTIKIDYQNKLKRDLYKQHYSINELY